MIVALVLNLDRRPDRWQATSAHLWDLGARPVRFPAIDAGPGAPDKLRRQAISRSYGKLLAGLLRPVLVIQDDVRLRSLPEWNERGLMILGRPRDWVKTEESFTRWTGSGYRQETREVKTSIPEHLCPKAFYVDPETARRMAPRFERAAHSCRTLAQLAHEERAVMVDCLGEEVGSWAS